jgi:CheY-like chemotaxis protein
VSSFKTPTNSGFGLRVIAASIEQQLGGKANFDWDRKGLRCTISIPRSKLMHNPALAGRQQVSNGNSFIELKSTERPCVLLVENEALVGMMLDEALNELGFQVIGPVGSESEAFAVARDNHFDAAVLDVNLGDELVYRIADVLKQRGVPFVFVTGYGVDGVDCRFSTVPVLQKPVELEMLQQVFLGGPERIGHRRFCAHRV